MAAKKNDDAARLLTRITVDAEGDDEQLWALAEAVASALHLPADAFVVGEPVQVTDVDYEGDPRLGLRATCRRRDERHVVGFADVVFAPAAPAPASRPPTARGWASRHTT